MDREYWLTGFGLALFLISYSLIAYFFQPAVAIHDFHIFYNAADKLLSTGQLYERDIKLYFPTSPTYKFPPILCGILSELISNGLHKDQIKWLATLVHITFLPIAMILLIKSIRTTISTEKILFIGFIFSVASYGFILDNLSRLQPDAIISFIIMIAIFLCSKNHYFLAGFSIGIATGIKIYPFLFALIFLIPINYKAIYGLALGLLSTIVAGALLTNQSESLFFFSRILPSLVSEPAITFHENISTPFFIFSIIGESEYSLIAIRLIMLLPLLAATILTANNRNDEIETLLLAMCCCTILMFMHNAWWNYQIILVIPCVVTTIIFFSNNYRKIKIAAIISLIVLYSLSTSYLKHFEITKTNNEQLSFILMILNHLTRVFWPVFLATLCCLCIKKIRTTPR